ncbi:S24 family peptidase [Bosea sp. FBZP-16]|uniref:S24 family peptidase n=1 Tax=Bosea sp. FBZP-16 TaxID=2065382 RepID=UPI000C30330E|nr:S24 family peptidase [Bosea sp. FBZP-16]
MLIDPAKVAERLSDAINRAGGRGRVAALTEIPQSSIDRYCRNQSEIPAIRLGEIARACDVTTDHLIYGDPIPLNLVRTELITEALNDNVVMIPMLDVIASAGPGIENARPYEIGKLPFPRAWLNELGLPEKFARFADSRGDSMTPTIPDGAICLIDIRIDRPRKDGIYVLVDGNNVRIKRIAIGWQGAIQLLSDNERYAPEQLAAPDAEALRVAGRVVWAGGEV